MYPLSQVRRDRCVQHNHQILELFSERTLSLSRKLELKDTANFFRFSWEVPVWCKHHMNKGTNRQEEGHSWFPWKCRWFVWNTSSKCNTYVVNSYQRYQDYNLLRQTFVNQEIKHFDIVIFRYNLQSRMYPSRRQNTCI